MLETAIDARESATEFLKSKPKKNMLMGRTKPAPAAPPQFAYMTMSSTAKYPSASMGNIGKTPLCKQRESPEQNSNSS